MMSFKSLFSSKKRNVACWLVAILSTFFIIAAKYQPTSLQVVPAQHSQYKAVIFDLGDVLFTTSTTAKVTTVLPTMFQNPTLFYRLIGFEVKQELFKMLDKVPAQTTEPMYNQGKKLPQIMVDWMTGRPSSEIRLEVLRQIRKSHYSTAIKNLFRSITRLMFDPATFTNSQIPIKPMVDLIKKLKQNGYKLYVLSNWETESYKLLKKEHVDLFGLFDGIMISGQEKMGKPNPELYTRLLKKYNLDCAQCVFIDDETYNTQAAEKLGVHSIVCTNTSSVCKGLINLGVMTLK